MRFTFLLAPALCLAVPTSAFGQSFDTDASARVGGFTPRVTNPTPRFATPPQKAGTITEFSDRTTFENTVGVPLTVEDFTPTTHFPLESPDLNSETECLGCNNPLFEGDIQPGVTYNVDGSGEPFFFNIDGGGNYAGLGGFLDGFAGAPWLTTRAEMTFWGSSPGDPRLISAFGFDCAFQEGTDIEVVISFDQDPDQTFTYPAGSSLTFFGFQSDATDISAVRIRNVDPGGGIFFGFDFDNFTFEEASVGPTCTDNSLTTTFASNNGGAEDWMTLKDINVVNPNGMDVTAFDINNNGAAGTAVEIDIYTTPGGLAGKELDMSQWTLVATGSATSAPEDSPTFVDTTDFNLAPGLWGIGIHYRVGSGPAYTNGNGPNESYANCDMDLDACCSITGLFTGTIFSPRVFNGTVYTCSVSHPGRVYCTAKTNSCGTVPSISASGTPSAAATSGHVITASNARANRRGLLIYSDQGQAATPFDGGFICVGGMLATNPPVANSGGMSGCDGAYSLDMNAYAGDGSAAAFLSVPGTDVNVQWIGRDTMAAGSFLSDGLQYCVGL